jgi:hypothetical protein
MEILKEQQNGLEALIKNIRRNLHKQQVIEQIIERK